MLRATPRLAWKSPNRLTPSNASRTISSDQRSPMTSSARATGQLAVFIRFRSAIDISAQRKRRLLVAF